MGTIGNWLILAEAEGFGLNFDILDTNLINLAILIGILVFYGGKIISNILLTRRNNIAEAIEEAEQRLKKAAEELAKAKENLALAKEQGEKIIQEAKERAKAASEAIAAKTAQDIERLKEMAQKDLNTERERAIAELRQRVAAMAVDRVESQLKTQLDQSAQQQLVDRSIARIGGG